MLNIRDHMGPREIASFVKPGDMVIGTDRGIYEVENVEPVGPGFTDVRVTTAGKLPRTLVSRQIYDHLPQKY